MADWGAGLQGLAGGLTKGYQLGLATQEEQRRKAESIAHQAAVEQQLGMQQEQMAMQKQVAERQQAAQVWQEKKGQLEFFRDIYKDENTHPKIRQSIYDGQIRPFAEESGHPLPEHDFMGDEDNTFSKKLGGLLGSVADDPRRAAVVAASIRAWALEPGRTKREIGQADKAVGDVFKMGEMAKKEDTQSALDQYRQDMVSLRQDQMAKDERQHRERMAEIAASKSGDSTYDKTLVTKTVTELPKLKKEAISGVSTLAQTNRALELVEKGVTGKGGQLKAFLAPYAEMVGINSEGLNDAQAFQLFTRAVIGPMRLDLIGPGPVSEYEQKLMQQLSGSGGTAKSAAKELLGYYQSLAKKRVDNYNETLEGVSSLAPHVGKVYKPVIVEQGKAPSSYSQTDIEFTAKKHGISTDEVKKRLGVK
jgi:hypothetical protein